MKGKSKQPEVPSVSPAKSAPIQPAEADIAVAARIEALAARDGTPLEQDPMLTYLLSGVPSDEIPQSLYAAMAEVLSFLYRADESIDSFD